MTWESSINPNDPHAIYRTGKESRPRDTDFDPTNRESDTSVWPIWSNYKKRDLSDFPGATARIAKAEIPTAGVDQNE